MKNAMRGVALLAVGVLLLAACGDGDDDGATPTATSTATGDAAGGESPTAGQDSPGDGDEIAAEHVAYCTAVQVIDDSEQGPTPELVQDVVAAAPEEIAAEAQTVGTAFAEAEGDFGSLTADAEFRAAFNALEQFEAENCGPEQADPQLIQATGDTEAAEGATVVEVTAVDYGFDAELEGLAAGSYAFDVTNGGEAGHEAFIGKLAEGVTLQEVLDFEGDPFAEGLVTGEVGFVLVPTPGDTRVINAELDAGTYGLVCFIPGPEGTPHAFLGMAREFTVG